MIDEIIKLSDIGLLRDALPDGPLALSQAVAVYADNGRGKSTLASLLRSLRDNDCDEVRARRTLGAEGEPHAELLIGGEKYTLSDGSWDKTHQGVHVYDDFFVEEHVSLGRILAAMHLENLLAFVLGSAGPGTAEAIADALDEYQGAVNARLRVLGAEFEIAELQRVDAEEGTRLEYALRFMGRDVQLATGEPATPDFSTTLSRGDRRLLALAFFLAALDDVPDLSGQTLVFDDPASGFDGRRTARVADAIVDFVGRGIQVVVLSPDAAFIRRLRDRSFSQVLQLGRSALYGVIEECDIDAVCAMDYEDDEAPPAPY